MARNNSVFGLVYAVKAGVALAALPTALGDAEPELVRVFGPITEPLPPLLRELVEGVLTGIVDVETYAEAAECLRVAIELEYLRLSPKLQLNDNEPVAQT